MSTTVPSPVRTRLVFAFAVVALLAALAIQAVHVGASPLQDPGVANLSVNFSTATDGLNGGDSVQFTVTASNGLGLFGVEAHLCKTGFAPSSYTTTNYGYTGSGGNRCVKEFTPGGVQPAVPSGGLQPYVAPSTLNRSGVYRLDPVAFNGASQTTPTFTLDVATGSVTWVNASGFNFSMDCGPGHPCDLVIKVDTNDQTTPTAYFVETLNYAGEVTSTTSSPTTSTSSPSTTSTTTSSTTSTSTTSTPTTSTPTTTTPTTTTPTTTTPTTTTRTPSSTSTTHSSSSTSDPTTPLTVAPTVSSGTSSGALAFTGASTRDLLSIALVLIAVGLFLLGERERRRGRT